MANSQFKTYVQHNVATFTGRVADATVRKSKNGEFLSVAVIHAMEDGDDNTVELSFTTSNGLLSFVKKGYDLVGRMITLTGHLSGLECYYVTESGDMQLLKRPRVKLTNVSVLQGGMGPAPSKGEKPTPRKGAVLKPAQARVELDNRQEDVATPAEPVGANAPIDEKPPF